MHACNILSSLIRHTFASKSSPPRTLLSLTFSLSLRATRNSRDLYAVSGLIARIFLPQRDSIQCPGKWRSLLFAPRSARSTWTREQEGLRGHELHHLLLDLQHYCFRMHCWKYILGTIASKLTKQLFFFFSHVFFFGGEKPEVRVIKLFFR